MRPRRKSEEAESAPGTGGAGGAEPSVVLYRCPTPTNFLCPCGYAERKLKRAGIPHRVERVPYNRRKRPEIEELTGQRRVPVLVDSDEIVHDSRRIGQYVDWKRSQRKQSADS